MKRCEHCRECIGDQRWLADVVPAVVVATIAVFFPNPSRPLGRLARKLVGQRVCNYRTEAV